MYFRDLRLHDRLRREVRNDEMNLSFSSRLRSMETLTEGSEEKRDETCARAPSRRTPQKRELAKKWMDVRD